MSGSTSWAGPGWRTKYGSRITYRTIRSTATGARNAIFRQGKIGARSSIGDAGTGWPSPGGGGMAGPLGSLTGGLWYGTVGAEEGRSLIRLVVQQPPGACDHGRQRMLGQMDRNLAVLGQAHVQPTQQGAATGHEQPGLQNVVRELWRALGKALPRAPDARADDLLEDFADLLGGRHDDGLAAAPEVGALDLGQRRVGRGLG